MNQFFIAAVQAIDNKFGANYAQKNPALVAKYIDLIIAERGLQTQINLTKREQFAMVALQGFLAGGARRQHIEDLAAVAAELAVKTADELIAELEDETEDLL